MCILIQWTVQSDVSACYEMMYVVECKVGLLVMFYQVGIDWLAWLRLCDNTSDI